MLSVKDNGSNMIIGIWLINKLNMNKKNHFHRKFALMEFNLIRKYFILCQDEMNGSGIPV